MGGETISLNRQARRAVERDTPVEKADVIPELAPQWDPKATFLGMGGMVGVAFMQGDNYFNCRKEFVKEVPLKDRREMPEPPKAPQVFHRGPRMIGRSPNGEHTTGLPDGVAQAHKENAKVLKAEALAE